MGSPPLELLHHVEDELSSTLMLGKFSLSSKLEPLLLLYSLRNTPRGHLSTKDLHDKCVLTIKLAHKEFPPGQAKELGERLLSPTQEHGVIDIVLHEDPGGAIWAAIHLQPQAWRPAALHHRREGFWKINPATDLLAQIHDELEGRKAQEG